MTVRKAQEIIQGYGRLIVDDSQPRYHQLSTFILPEIPASLFQERNH